MRPKLPCSEAHCRSSHRTAFASAGFSWSESWQRRARRRFENARDVLECTPFTDTSLLFQWPHHCLPALPLLQNRSPLDLLQNLSCPHEHHTLPCSSFTATCHNPFAEHALPCSSYRAHSASVLSQGTPLHGPESSPSQRACVNHAVPCTSCGARPALILLQGTASQQPSAQHAPPSILQQSTSCQPLCAKHAVPCTCCTALPTSVLLQSSHHLQGLLFPAPAAQLFLPTSFCRVEPASIRLAKHAWHSICCNAPPSSILSLSALYQCAVAEHPLPAQRHVSCTCCRAPVTSVLLQSPLSASICLDPHASIFWASMYLLHTSPCICCTRPPASIFLDSLQCPALSADLPLPASFYTACCALHLLLSTPLQHPCPKHAVPCTSCRLPGVSILMQGML